MRLSLWSFFWDKGKVLPSEKTQVLSVRTAASGLVGNFDAPSIDSKVHEFEIWLEPDDMITMNLGSIEGTSIYNKPGRLAMHQGPGIAIDWMEVEGPIHPQWPPAGHTELFGALPIEKFEATEGGPGPPFRTPPLKIRRDASAIPVESDHGKVDGIWTIKSRDPGDDARRLLKHFLTRAFRRPATDEQVAIYMGIFDARVSAGDCFEDALRQTYLSALCAPEFLFHIEHVGKLDAPALASRLSYFLWNGPPDAQLAAQGDLPTNSDALRTHVRRMLADPRSERFINDFLDQWLNLSQIASTTPDPQLYPEYKPYIRDCMLAETRAFFRHVVNYNLAAINVVDSDFVMVNSELGKLYGLPEVPEGDAISNVRLPPGSHRGGLLTQASVLKVTANGSVTSPVKRGAWVMDRLLGKPPEPPPPAVTAIEPDLRGATTIRQQLDLHRNQPSCAGCHDKMDPPGFALESFDVIGRWRTRYRSREIGDPSDAKVKDGYFPVSYKLGMPVDSTGQTVDGQAFKDIDEFKKLLLRDERQVARNLLIRLTVYATGAEVGFSDRATIEQILDKSEQVSDEQRRNYGIYGIRSLLEEMVCSDLFLSK